MEAALPFQPHVPWKTGTRPGDDRSNRGVATLLSVYQGRWKLQQKFAEGAIPVQERPSQALRELRNGCRERRPWRCVAGVRNGTEAVPYKKTPSQALRELRNGTEAVPNKNNQHRPVGNAVPGVP